MLDIETFPIVVPPIEIGDLSGILQVTQYGSLKDHLHLERLRDAALRATGGIHEDSDNWLARKIEFMDRLDSILSSLPAVVTVTQDDLKLEQQRASVYRHERDELKKLVEQKDEYIKALEAERPAEVVARVKLEQLPEAKQFEVLVDAARSLLRQLPSPVDEVLYFDQLGREYFLGDFESGAEAEDAADRGLIRRIEGYGRRAYGISSGDKRVQVAQTALNRLSTFLQSTSEEFENAFFEKHGYRPELSNKSFWSDFLF